MAEEGTTTKPRGGRRRGGTIEPRIPQPPSGSVMDELMNEAERQPAEPTPADAGEVLEPDAGESPDGAAEQRPQTARKARKAAPAPARRPAAPQARRGGATGRRRPWAMPMPDGYGGVRGAVPVQAFLPPQEHWDFKVATMLQTSDMSKTLLALIEAYLRAPDQWSALFARFAAAAGTDDELLDGVLREALVAALETDAADDQD